MLIITVRYTRSMSTKNKNPLSDLDLRSFSLTGRRLFFALLSLVEEGESTVHLNLGDIRALGIFADRHIKLQMLIKAMDNFTRDAYSLFFHEATPSEGAIFVHNIRLFKEITYEINDSRKFYPDYFQAFIEIDPEAMPLMKKLHEFISFELEDFQKLTRSYSQKLFIYLYPFKKAGTYKVSQEELKRLLNVPENYRQSDIDRRILKPAIEELRTSLFPNLNYTKEKNDYDKRRVTGYIFTFKKSRS